MFSYNIFLWALLAVLVTSMTIGAFIIVTLWVGQDYLRRENALRAAWEEFALSNDLTMVTFWMFPGTKVIGSYQGYQIRLESSRKPKEKDSAPCVRLTIAAENGKLLGNDSSWVIPLSLDEAMAKLTAAPFDRRGELKLTPRGQRMVYEQLGTETDPARLQLLFDGLVELAEAYRHLVAVGGELIPYLEELRIDRIWLRPFLSQLAQAIGQDTKARLAKQAAQLYCEACITWCAAHKSYLRNWPVIYYGCRTCKQSQDFFYVDHVIAVLDRHMNDEVRLENDTLRVNWFAQGEPFDFDWVEIIAASDEEVERFAVQVGNDTEPWRQPRYRQLPCVVHPLSGLSENTLKILKRTFGQVTLTPSE